MGLRRAFYRWMIPGAFVLPLWLFIGWIVSGASALSLLWVLISAPIVFVGQLVLSLLVRARGTARAERAASWQDVWLIGGWNALIVTLGFFSNPWWWGLFALTIAVGLGALWSVLWQLWQEAGSRSVLRASNGVGYIPAQPTPRQGAMPQDVEVIVVREKSDPPSS